MTRPPLIPNPQSLIPSSVRGAANGFIAALLAPACAVCDTLLDEPLSGCVCEPCWRSIRPITPPICDRCGDPLPRPDSSHSHCSDGPSAITRARAVGEYEGTLRDIIHALKYAGRLSLARPLAAQMRARGSDVLTDVDCLVPVPLHWRRKHQRGFNQAREIARYLGLPVVEALRRRRATRPQVELAADRRKTNVADAFALRRGWFRDYRIRGKVLLIDDVSTTGATLEACAAVLRDSGASDVYALTAARVVTRRRHGIPDP
jgi:ComF family protein